MARAGWYDAHPPGCTCWRCNEGRRRRRARERGSPPPPPPAPPRGVPPTSPPPRTRRPRYRRRSSFRRRLFRAVRWAIVLAVIGVPAYLLAIEEGTAEERARGAWARVESTWSESSVGQGVAAWWEEVNAHATTPSAAGGGADNGSASGGATGQTAPPPPAPTPASLAAAGAPSPTPAPPVSAPPSAPLLDFSATVVPTPTSVFVSPVIPTITVATPVPVPTATPTPVAGPPHLRHLELKEYMLELINAERERAGVGPVALGVNDAAQLHAESSLENCISSHWSIDGLNPDMRYSLAGGYQSNRENVLGRDYCLKASDWVRGIGNVRGKAADSIDSWMGSSGHRTNLLHPAHKFVNIGLSWDDFNFFAVQQFEGDYVEYTTLPSIEGRQLLMQGRVKNGANLAEGNHSRVTLLYSPPPHSLTRGQIAQVYAICSARKAAILSYISSGTSVSSWRSCPSPYDFPTESPAPSSAAASRQMWEDARLRWENRETLLITIHNIKMSRWELEGDRFLISADLGPVLDQHGPGVYTVVLFAVLEGSVQSISEYSIFHEIDPPDTYSAYLEDGG